MDMTDSKQTSFGWVSKKVYDELCKAGWSPDRNVSATSDSFSEAWGSEWVPAATSFLRNFSGLSFYGRLWVWNKPIKDQDITAAREKISDVAGSRVIPVASSSFIGDGCLIWIDECGRYYAVDSEGMVFIASDMAAALEVLLGEKSLPEPPPELKEKLAAAYEWGSE
ncbi:MAG: SUKH-3 domain-containing protein [Verrucomicrobiota bacterium]